MNSTVAAEGRVRTRQLVLADVLAEAPTTRVAIAQRTGLSTATVTRVTEVLIADGLIEELALLPAVGRGRRPMAIDIVGAYAVAIGIDVGASNTRIVTLDLGAKVLDVDRSTTPIGLDAVALAEHFVALAKRVTGTRYATVGGVAVGLPGAVNPRTREVSNAPHLPQIEDPHFLEALESGFGRRIEIDNDANHALLGERSFGAARRTPNAVMFTLGAGLGAGVTIDGRLLRGRNGLVGEFGALPIGPLGSRLEHLVTGFGIMLRAAELGLPLESPATLFLETGNDERLLILRRQFEQALVVAITAAVVGCDPEIVVLGGGVASSLHASIADLEEAVRANLRVAPEIVIAELGDLSGALGAAVQALQNIYLELGIPDDQLARLPRPAVDLSSARVPE